MLMILLVLTLVSEVHTSQYRVHFDLLPVLCVVKCE